MTGTTLTWTVPTLQPVVATLTYTVTVNAGAFNQTLVNVATPGRVGSASSGGLQHRPHHARLQLAKSSDPADRVDGPPGDTVAYTLTATNNSQAV